MKALDDAMWCLGTIADSIPDTDEMGLLDWAPKNIRLVGSVRSERFDPEITPWLKKAYEAVSRPEVSCIDLVMPAQSGKSAFGEIVICWWISVKPAGDIQYNWESDEKGKARFKKRVFRILENCPPVKARLPKKQTDANPVIAFPHLNFTMQGVSVSDKLESDSITLQLNEELHGWKDGRKKLADKRVSAVWNSLQGNISTGGKVGDQLHTSWKGSSQEMWEEPCDNPECGEYQHWHHRALPDKLGGLRYKIFKKEDGSFDFPKIAETIYYECEHCGYKHYDDYEARRQRAAKGRYPDEGFAEHIGLHMEQVSVYWIKYITIVQEKLEALQALKRGDKNPWIFYLQRSEGWFYDPRQRPHVEALRTAGEAKMKVGLEKRQLRAMTVDRQRGRTSQGETPYYWVVIRDWISPRQSMLVWAGRLEVGQAVESLREKYGVDPLYVLIDSGWDANHVYRLCAQYGYTAIKGDPSKREYFPHRIKKETVFRIYQPLKWIEPWDGAAAQGIPKIPFLLYSKSGIRDRLETLRDVAGDGWGVPSDIEDHCKDYNDHMNAEEKEEQTQTDGSSKMVWIQHAARNDLFVCECYQTLIIDLADLQELAEEEEKPAPPNP